MDTRSGRALGVGRQTAREDEAANSSSEQPDEVVQSRRGCELANAAGVNRYFEMGVKGRKKWGAPREAILATTKTPGRRNGRREEDSRFVGR